MESSGDLLAFDVAVVISLTVIVVEFEQVGSILRVADAICVGCDLKLKIVDSQRPLPNFIDETAPAAV